MTASTFALPVGLVLLAMSSFGWLTFQDGAGTLGEPAVLVFPPTWSAQAVLAATASLGAPILDIGPAPFVSIIVFETEDAIQRAYDAGVLVILNAKAASLCGISGLA